MLFGLFGTKSTNCNREVSVRSGSNLFIKKSVRLVNVLVARKIKEFSFYFQTADHMFNLDIAEMEKGIHRLNTLIPLMTMTDIGHSDSKQLPKFPTFDYFRSNPEILWDSPLQREKKDSMLPSNLDTLALLDQKCPVEDEDDYIHWPEPETPAEFATVGYYGMVRNITVSENNDTDNARPESNENLSL